MPFMRNTPKIRPQTLSWRLLLKENEQHSDALPFAESAVKFAPENAGYLAFLGKLYVDLRLIEFAPMFSTRRSPWTKRMFQAPWALAHYYLESGQGRLALPYFDLALRSCASGLQEQNPFWIGRCVCGIWEMQDEAEPDFEKVMKDPKVRIRALARLVLLKRHDQTQTMPTRFARNLNELT